MSTDLSPNVLLSAYAIWDYLRVDDELGPTDIGVALGGHDIGPAIRAAELFHQGTFPLIVFTGANSPTTVDRFPRGEAQHYREEAVRLGVPDSAIIVEPASKTTAENITMSRDVLIAQQVTVDSVTLIAKPYQQRYALGVIRKLWPEVTVQCTAELISLSDYISKIGSDRVLTMLVGDLQRVVAVPSFGLAAEQNSPPPNVIEAYWQLVDAGYRGRMIPNAPLSVERRPTA